MRMKNVPRLFRTTPDPRWTHNNSNSNSNNACCILRSKKKTRSISTFHNHNDNDTDITNPFPPTVLRKSGSGGIAGRGGGTDRVQASTIRVDISSVACCMWVDSSIYHHPFTFTFHHTTPDHFHTQIEAISRSSTTTLRKWKRYVRVESSRFVSSSKQSSTKERKKERERERKNSAYNACYSLTYHSIHALVSNVETKSMILLRYYIQYHRIHPAHTIGHRMATGNRQPAPK